MQKVTSSIVAIAWSSRCVPHVPGLAMFEIYASHVGADVTKLNRWLPSGLNKEQKCKKWFKCIHILCMGCWSWSQQPLFSKWCGAFSYEFLAIGHKLQQTSSFHRQAHFDAVPNQNFECCSSKLCDHFLCWQNDLLQHHKNLSQDIAAFFHQTLCE